MTEVQEFRITLTVDDFDAAVRLYRDALGLPEVADWSLSNGSDQVEHSVDHVTRGEDLAVGLDAVPGLHELLDDRLRRSHWCPLCGRR